MRLAARTALQPSGNGSDAKETTRESKESSAAETKDRDSTFGPAAYTSSDEEKAQPKLDGPAGAWAKSVGGGGGGGAKHVQAKPAWAMTEQAAEGQDEELQRGEEEELLDFARGLDFDRYIGDVEVQAVMERLRRRISDLEREVAMEDMRHADADTRAALRAKLEQMVSLSLSCSTDRVVTMPQYASNYPGSTHRYRESQRRRCSRRRAGRAGTGRRWQLRGRCCRRRRTCRACTPPSPWPRCSRRPRRRSRR